MGREDLGSGSLRKLGRTRVAVNPLTILVEWGRVTIRKVARLISEAGLRILSRAEWHDDQGERRSEGSPVGVRATRDRRKGERKRDETTNCAYLMDAAAIKSGLDLGFKAGELRLAKKDGGGEEILEGPSTAGQSVVTARTALGNGREKRKRGVQIRWAGSTTKPACKRRRGRDPGNQRPRAVEELTEAVGGCDVFKINQVNMK